MCPFFSFRVGFKTRCSEWLWWCPSTVNQMEFASGFFSRPFSHSVLTIPAPDLWMPIVANWDTCCLFLLTRPSYLPQGMPMTFKQLWILEELVCNSKLFSEENSEKKESCYANTINKHAVQPKFNFGHLDLQQQYMTGWTSMLWIYERTLTCSTGEHLECWDAPGSRHGEWSKAAALQTPARALQALCTNWDRNKTNEVCV